MSGVTRLLLLLIAMAGALSACGSAEKQWYKPGADYTVADFQRDRAACEKGGALDEVCLKQRGWVPLSVDKDTSKPPSDHSIRGRY
jgi:hypothetical protein